MLKNRLNILRNYLNMSQIDLSKKLELSYRTYTSYERGERKPSIDFFEKLYKIFNVNLNWLIVGEGEMFNKTQKTDDEELKSKVELLLKEKGLID